MGCINYCELVNEIAKRTIHNLDMINNNLDKGIIYEVTQLLNSLMGLVIIPAEKYKIKNNSDGNESLEKKLEKYCEKEYNSLLNQIKKLHEEKKLRIEERKKLFDKYPVTQFIRHMRNAAAHSGDGMIIFYPTYVRAAQIQGLYFQDTDDKNSYQFCAKLKIEELEQILRIIASLYSKYEDANHNDKPENLWERENDLDNFLKGD